MVLNTHERGNLIRSLYTGTYTTVGCDGNGVMTDHCNLLYILLDRKQSAVVLEQYD